MHVVTHTDWLERIPAASPRYDYDHIVPVPDIDLRYINIRHHTDGGIPDYMREVVRSTDVYVPELPGWSPETAKRMERMVKGDYKARERIIADAAWLKSRDPGAFDYQTFVMKALYDSKVKLAFVDVSSGREFDKMNSLMQAMNRGENDIVYPAHQMREQRILETLVTRLTEMRSQPGLASKTPLKVAMTYGAMHMGMADGLVEAASIHGVDINVTQEFEDSMAVLVRPEGEDQNDQVFADSVVNYQTWLRTEAA